MNLFVECAEMLVRLVLVSVLCCLLDLSVILDWGKRLSPSDVKSVLELFDVVHHLLVHVKLLLQVWSCEFVTFGSCWIPTASW